MNDENLTFECQYNRLAHHGFSQCAALQYCLEQHVPFKFKKTPNQSMLIVPREFDMHEQNLRTACAKCDLLNLQAQNTKSR